MVFFILILGNLKFQQIYGKIGSLRITSIKHGSWNINVLFEKYLTKNEQS